MGRFDNGAVFVPSYSEADRAPPFKFITTTYAAVITISYPLIFCVTLGLEWLADYRLSAFQNHRLQCCLDYDNITLYRWAENLRPDEVSAYYSQWKNVIDTVISRSWAALCFGVPMVFAVAVIIVNYLLKKMRAYNAGEDTLLKVMVVLSASNTVFLMLVFVFFRLILVLDLLSQHGLFAFLFDQDNSLLLSVLLYIYLGVLAVGAFGQVRFLRKRKFFAEKYGCDIAYAWKGLGSWKYWAATLVATVAVGLASVPALIATDFYAIKPLLTLDDASDVIITHAAYLRSRVIYPPPPPPQPSSVLTPSRQ